MYHHRKRGWMYSQVDKLGLVSLFMSIGIAFMSTIWAIYLESIFNNASIVGFIITLFAIVAGVSYIFFIPIIEKNKKTTIFFTTLIFYFISYILFSFLDLTWAIVILGCLLYAAGSLRVTSFGIILRDKSKDNAVSKNIGLITTLLNFAWLIGPLAAGFIAEQLGIRSVFWFAAGLILISLLLFKTFKIQDNRVEKKIDKNTFKVIGEFLKNKDRRLIYIISGSVTFWWTLIYVYMPIRIIESGLHPNYVGYFLAAVVVPLVLLEYKFGKITAKKGFKKMFVWGHLIVALIALLCFFMENIFISMGLIVLASVGMAMLEPTTEAYFFDIVKEKERDKFYGPYNTTIDVSSTISTLLIALLLLFLPFKFIFIFLFAVMIIFTLISLKIKEVIESKRGKKRFKKFAEQKAKQIRKEKRLSKFKNF